MLRKTPERSHTQTNASDTPSEAKGSSLRRNKAAGPSLKSRAIRLLAAREHSRAELQRKLSPHAESESELLRLLDELTAKGFISDQRVIASVLHQRAHQRGMASLRQTLQTKGVAAVDFEPALAGLADSEADRAWDVWSRRYGQRSTASERPATDDNARTRHELSQERQREAARQMRFLIGRGFSPGIANATLRRARIEAGRIESTAELQGESANQDASNEC